jgi:hypothetical protein
MGIFKAGNSRIFFLTSLCFPNFLELLSSSKWWNKFNILMNKLHHQKEYCLLIHLLKTGTAEEEGGPGIPL